MRRPVRDTLQILLRSISKGDYFNIIGFGSTTEWLFDDVSVPYDETSLTLASEHVSKMTANLGLLSLWKAVMCPMNTSFMLDLAGGTELLPPLKAIFDRPVAAECLRQLFILTDGEGKVILACCCF